MFSTYDHGSWIFTFGETVLKTLMWSKWNDALYTPIYWVYYADVFAYLTELAVAAIVVACAVDAAIRFDIGKYF